MEHNYRPEPKKRIKPRSFKHPKDRVVTWRRRKKTFLRALVAAQAASRKAAGKAGPTTAPAPALPAPEQLTPESDFSGFMHPKVEDALRRVALKKLFSDPHFNLPDPFEAYSGDWTGGEPIPEEMLATLNQARTLALQR